ncbi:hypothetical protein NEAUS06_0141 [Nematocida ausubeli]|nr:hypothetical protein NEAUS06_0141 [Nematocida ausubeli]
MKTTQIQKILFTAACFAAGRCSASYFDFKSSDAYPDPNMLLDGSFELDNFDTPIAFENPKSAKSLSTLSKSIVLLNQDATDCMYDSVNECMELLKKYICKFKKSSSIDFSFNEAFPEEIDLASLAVYLNTTTLFAVTEESKTSLMNAILDFDYYKIESELRSIYISLVNSEHYNMNFLECNLENTKKIRHATIMPMFYISKNSLGKCESSKIECIEKEEQAIKKAASLMGASGKSKKNSEGSMNGVFQIADHLEISKPTDNAKTTPSFYGFLKNLFHIKRKRNLVKMQKEELYKTYKPVGIMGGRTVGVIVKKGECSFKKWQNEVTNMSTDSTIPSQVSSGCLKRIPWAYLDARIFANTDLKFDLQVVSKIVSSLTKDNFLIMEDELAFFVLQLNKYSPILKLYLDCLNNIIKKYVGVLEKKHKSATWIKARVYNIVIEYVKGGLSLPLIKYNLEQIICDMIMNLERSRTLTSMDALKIVLQLEKGNPKTMKTTSSWDIYRKKPCTVPFLLQHLI